MNSRIVTADGAVIHSLNPSATIAKLMEAASTPAVFDFDTGQETSAKSYPAADTVYEVVDIDEVDLRTHKWLSSTTTQQSGLRFEQREIGCWLRLIGLLLNHKKLVKQCLPLGKPTAPRCATCLPTPATPPARSGRRSQRSV
jgi:hypothetical protein